MSIDFDAISVPEIPAVQVVEAPAFTVVGPPTLSVGVGPPQVAFVPLDEPEAGVVRVVVGAPPQGADGSGERVEFTVTAGFTIQAFRLVVPRVQQPNVRHAMPDYMPHVNRPLWLTLHSALAGEPVRVVAVGIVDNEAWDWIQAPIYLGLDGTLTQVVPEAPEVAFCVQVGYPVNPDSMFIRPSPAINLV